MQKNGRTLFVAFLLAVWVPAIAATAWLTFRIGRLEGKVEAHMLYHSGTEGDHGGYAAAD
jgi:hypothetical protein